MAHKKTFLILLCSHLVHHIPEEGQWEQLCSLYISTHNNKEVLLDIAWPTLLGSWYKDRQHQHTQERNMPPARAELKPGLFSKRQKAKKPNFHKQLQYSKLPLQKFSSCSSDLLVEQRTIISTLLPRDISWDFVSEQQSSRSPATSYYMSLKHGLAVQLSGKRFRAPRIRCQNSPATTDGRLLWVSSLALQHKF